LRVMPRQEDRPIDVEQDHCEHLDRRAQSSRRTVLRVPDGLGRPSRQAVQQACGTSTLLANLATLLHGLQLTPGTTVLEFWRRQRLDLAMVDTTRVPRHLAGRFTNRTTDRARTVSACASRRSPAGTRIPRVRQPAHRAAGRQRRSHSVFDAFHHVPNPTRSCGNWAGF